MCRCSTVTVVRKHWYATVLAWILQGPHWTDLSNEGALKFIMEHTNDKLYYLWKWWRFMWRIYGFPVVDCKKSVEYSFRINASVRQQLARTLFNRASCAVLGRVYKHPHKQRLPQWAWAGWREVALWQIDDSICKLCSWYTGKIDIYTFDEGYLDTRCGLYLCRGQCWFYSGCFKFPLRTAPEP